MIVLGIILLIIGTGIFVTAVTLATSQLKENNEDHFDFLEYVFNKPRTIWTDVISKLILMLVVFILIIFIVLGLACLIKAGGA